MDLPAVIESSSSAESVELILQIDSTLEAFAGHFDSIGIIPGVVQIQWAIEFARLYVNEKITADITEIKKLKFQQVIQADKQVKLTLEVKDGSLTFTFKSANHKHSSGKILLN